MNITSILCNRSDILMNTMLFMCNRKVGFSMNNSKFKFRVWDLDNKEWYRSSQLVIRPYTGRVTDGATTPNVILSQCIGLEDVNGILIYEGDIIQSLKHTVEIYTIKWRNWHAGYNVIGLDMKDFKIIGNIYENPELI